jgi:hypothetical protein
MSNATGKTAAAGVIAALLVAQATAPSVSPAATAASPGRPHSVSAALARALTLVGPAGELPQLLAHDGYRASYYPVRPGRLRIFWTSIPTGMNTGHGDTIYARGHGVFTHAGHPGKIKVTLNKAGRRLLEQDSAVKIIANAVFTPPTDASTISIAETFQLSANPAVEL